MKIKGFTLAEVLITLAIIGVVAAISVPSVISNAQQTEFKTGLKKAVSVLNSAITASIALDGETPYDNQDLYNYLQRHMGVLKSVYLPWSSTYIRPDGTHLSSGHNYAFYTTDGMRFEFEDNGAEIKHLKLHESDTAACIATKNDTAPERACGGCGSSGLTHNPNNTTKPPCALMVDVNGDRKPNPANADAQYAGGQGTIHAVYKTATPGDKLIGDIFTILITEDRAIPYGVVAQKAMYEAQKY
ncbi:MAG: prepilin-type N-terminal cleavage/methylation domain-containing protein [bacterium]|nr:prepilin-type N-terminal cleavage/methylation domain-containing protein [bacterium]